MSVSEPKRTGRGLRSLRDRYVRRAEYLCTEPEWLEAVERTRDEWSTRFPTYRIVMLDEPRTVSLRSLRRQIEKDIEGDIASWQRHAEAVDAWHSTINDFVLDDDGEWRMAGNQHPVTPPLREFESFTASDKWDTCVRELGRQFWPMWAFHNPFVSGIRATDGMVAACLQTHPQLLRERCNELFPVFSLDAQVMRDRREELELDGFRPYMLSEMEWGIPVYPGMTRKDLVDAAGPIVDKMNRIFGPRSVGHLIDAARGHGHLTHRAIANMLGLEVDTVRKHLKQPENE